MEGFVNVHHLALFRSPGPKLTRQALAKKSGHSRLLPPLFLFLISQLT